MNLSQEVIENITHEVRSLLSGDTSGHNIRHVERVTEIALSFAAQEEADASVVWLASLLHDVDDYKLFGQESADGLINAHKILDSNHIDPKTKQKVLDIISSMGYNKFLQGIRPSTIEGKVVSDADMCDAIGATGILRTHAYALSKGNEFFDKNIELIKGQVSADQYRLYKKTHSAQHFFDKLLNIPSILMTDSGKKEGEKRKSVMVTFLGELFKEEGAEEWLEYLDEYEKRSR